MDAGSAMQPVAAPEGALPRFSYREVRSLGDQMSVGSSGLTVSEMSDTPSTFSEISPSSLSSLSDFSETGLVRWLLRREHPLRHGVDHAG